VLAEQGFNILLGTTLSGKTTLMQLMAGIDKPTTGEIGFKGKDVTGTPVQKRNVAMVYQQFINYPNFTVYENIASPLRVAKVPKSELGKRVERVAELMRLTPMLGRMPSELSGGQQQRVAIARALVKDADLVLLDEPLANLDYKLREELRDQLPELFAGRGAVVVYATSEPAEALMLGGRTALMQDGNVTQFGPTAQIYRRPNTLTSASVFSDPPINSAPVTKRGDRIELAHGLGWRLAGPAADLADGPYTVAIRPSDISPQRGHGALVPMTGTVQITELSGSESTAHFRLGETTWVSLSPGIHRFRVGEAHEFFLDPARCLYFAPDGALAV
jgi:glycerol transport system ATP-binding protein